MPSSRSNRSPLLAFRYALCEILKKFLIQIALFHSIAGKLPASLAYLALFFPNTSPTLGRDLLTTTGLLSFMGGYQSGYYSINPSQMHVDKPSNVDDSDIGPRSAYAQPINVPTDMAYAHCWYSIAEISRQVTDAISEAGCDADNMPYDILLELDRRFSDYLKSMPPFLRSDPTSLEKSKHLHEQRPILTYHRDMAQLLVHSRLYRLHRPYLARGSRYPRYSYSRTVCLRSARILIELSKELTSSWGPTPTKLWTIIHFNLVATLVLVIDYCLNREDPRAAERKAEILDCFRHLEGCQTHSAIARRGLKQLKELLARGFTRSRYLENGEPRLRDNAEGSRRSVMQVEKDFLCPAEVAGVLDPSTVQPMIAVPAAVPEAPASTTQPQTDQYADIDLSYENIDFESISFGMDDSFTTFFEALEGGNDFFQ